MKRQPLLTYTIKTATNSRLANRISDFININAGDIIDGFKTLEQLDEEITYYCIKVAIGEINHRALQLSQDDIIPWESGVSL